VEKDTIEVRERFKVFLQLSDGSPTLNFDEIDFPDLSSMIEALIDLCPPATDWNTLEAWTIVYYVLSGSLP
jgi:hypothetical protein